MNDWLLYVVPIELSPNLFIEERKHNISVISYSWNSSNKQKSKPLQYVEGFARVQVKYFIVLLSCFFPAFCRPDL